MMLQALQTVSVIAAILVAVGTMRGRKDDEVETLTEMRMDIKYIKAQVDDLSPLRNEMVEVRQIAKSAHKRLDEHLGIRGGD